MSNFSRRSESDGLILAVEILDDMELHASVVTCRLGSDSGVGFYYFLCTNTIFMLCNGQKYPPPGVSTRFDSVHRGCTKEDVVRTFGPRLLIKI